MSLPIQFEALRAAEVVPEITLAAALKAPDLQLTWKGNGHDQLTLTVGNKGAERVTLRLPAGLICANGRNERVMVLREAPIAIPPGAVTETQIPTAALSSKYGREAAAFAPTPDSEPRLAPLLNTLAGLNDLPRTTAQLLVLAVLEDVDFAEWQKFNAPAAHTEPTQADPGKAALDVVQAVDALGLLRQIAPEKKFALANDTQLKLKALHNPVCRAKALELYGMTIPGEPPAPGQQAPNLGQLLHTKAGDNCPICRMRQQMDRAAGDL